MGLSRRARAVGGAAAVVVLIVVAAFVHARTAGSPVASPTPTPHPTVTGPTATATASPTPAIATRGPAAPVTGAWVGAWVKPKVATDAGRVAAITGFESQIGRPLNVVNVYHSTEAFPTTADRQFLAQGKTLMISWAGDDTLAINSGQDDALIRARAEGVKALGVPILLRWRWEMNRPNLAASVGSPAAYVAAWKHVRAIFTAVGATNAGWVWCPLATNFDATNAAAFYPGDDQVDWLCADVYPGPAYDSFSAVAQQFVTWAGGHHRPIIIGEYGAQNLGNATQRAQWLTAATEYAKQQPQIKAMVYFEARVEQGTKSRDFTLVGTGTPLAAFRAMAHDPYFNQPSTSR